MEESKPRRFLRLGEVEQRVGLKHATIYSLLGQGLFPSQLKITPNGRAVGWLESDIDEYIDARVRASTNAA